MAKLGHKTCVTGSLDGYLLPAVAVGNLVEILPHYTCESMPVSLVHLTGETSRATS